MLGSNYSSAIPIHALHNAHNCKYNVVLLTHTNTTHKICSDGSSSNRLAGTATKSLSEMSLGGTNTWTKTTGNAVGLSHRHGDGLEITKLWTHSLHFLLQGAALRPQEASTTSRQPHVNPVIVTIANTAGNKHPNHYY